MSHHKIDQSTLFEVSWEVCNKVGGIYTVVSTKAPEAVACFGDQYYLLGPDTGTNREFQETDEPCWIPLRQALSIRSLSCRFGRWDIPGNPKVILVNFKDRYNQNQLLYELWRRHGVDSMTGGWDYIEPVMFGSACSEVINIAIKTLVEPIGNKPIAHFHEWMCGSGLLNLKMLSPETATVFTTHATILGRSMSGSGIDFSKNIGKIQPQREAAAYHISAKHSMESTSAQSADCFTTVSEITTEEAEVVLGRRPELTPNGLNLSHIKDFSQDPDLRLKTRTQILSRISQFLGYELPKNTRIMIISGRYEFHNKGIDLFIDALSNAEHDLHTTDNHILALCAAMGGHSGVTDYAKKNHIEHPEYPESPELLLTPNYAYNMTQDAIITRCLQKGLTNSKDNRVKFIFTPAELNGQDGFFNLTYEEILSGCDLGVFPSWYEPWGYTPQESAAHAVPTVTTDLAGFGLWVRHLNNNTQGISVINRSKINYDDAVGTLQKILMEYASCSEETLSQHRSNVRAVAQLSSWQNFFPYYIKAYQTALTKLNERISNHYIDDKPKTLGASRGPITPNLHTLTAISPLPNSLHRLREIVHNVWWSWQTESSLLFKKIDPQLWETVGHNPIQFLDEIAPETIEESGNNPEVQHYYRQLTHKFDVYMNHKPMDTGYAITPTTPIAYFSTEYGLHESIPLYSGGLGILSGDHLKSASDLRVSMIAVGLLYKNGYFQQHIDVHGNQINLYPENTLSHMPISHVKNHQGEPVYIELDLFPGRQLFAQVWKMQVGHVPLYLLDTDIPQNTPDDRRITAQLYVSDRDYRIRQEILLGMGGIRLINQLQIIPSVYHMNEGHSAFMILERIRNHMLWYNLSFQAAQECIRSNTVFTTHTPVDAGNERFDPILMKKYFSDYAKSINISWNDFMDLGQLPNSDRNMFEMTVLALRNASKINGVSHIHSTVSKHMWTNNWPGLPVHEVPIQHVTNGIHLPTYTGIEMDHLLKKYVHEEWSDLSLSNENWQKVDSIPDQELWEAHTKQKMHLLEKVKHSILYSSIPEHASSLIQQDIINQITQDTLVIGFARRFAPYKRANLILANPDRLYNILNNPEKPTILVFAGKAHPADQQGADLVKQVVQFTKDPRFYGKIFFLENYNASIGKLLVQGTDVWLNTPRRPYEACGTSGQKVSANGCLNLSISDGWWCEGYNGENGWTIGEIVRNGILPSSEQCDYEDADSLYELLEKTVLPLYFKRDSNNIPTQWISMVKNAIKTLVPQFSADRMLLDYLNDYYVPLTKQKASFVGNNFDIPRQISEWKNTIEQKFASVTVHNVNIKGLNNDIILYNQNLDITVKLNPGSMHPDELLVQFVIGLGKDSQFITSPDVVNLSIVHQNQSEIVFSGTYQPKTNGTHIYGIRVLPTRQGLLSPFETGLAIWV